MIKFFSTDIDGTLLGKPDALARFNATWDAKLNKQLPKLCYNTGRMQEDMLDLVEGGLLVQPDYMICGVGTSIYDFKKQETIKQFSDVLEEGWNRDTAVDVMTNHTPAKLQPSHYQAPYKSSWYWTDAATADIESLEARLESAGLDVHVIYSSSRDLDILPKYANKGNALSWLLKSLGISTSEVLVAGDTGNDTAMFKKKGIRGIVVGNAQPELHELTVGLNVYRAEEHCADGVIEGLLHFEAIEKVAKIGPGDPSAIKDPSVHPDTKRLIFQEHAPHLKPEEHAYLKEALEMAEKGLRRNITPLGFSACSLEDNVTEGTDQNYRSVWARDGSITVIGSLKLKDPVFRECQKATLETLLDHLSLTGQVPANVSLDTQTPDYSGVGGICSIDSGIWLIIACFEYVRHTNEVGFLRSKRAKLQRAMDWLSAHDSNNDGLLEVPEAGDWTDLFGRSYNPLYDEVLWYRANVAFGRMMEFLGEWSMAGDYLRWASHIKRSILRKFWPSVKLRDELNYTFADNQASLGDTPYLLAQTTPFSYDWRCDVYGNILAFLLDVISIEQAQKAFRFMWGTSVNEPFPVANLYPVVQAGDPDWKTYYTVNLLNLPHHYHNGGIWPFIGAMWVQFIHKLGFQELATKELIRLAKLNEAGVSRAWEFNEWAHGQTGKPMGKIYQAWSCSEFIKACHVLKLA
ncbi:MAG: HAD-IIB family hydrolase [Verrucomicrobiae bacterium]|nr:HAD-IIB family hydrolase [Verrucomicrobiae bacterium]